MNQNELKSHQKSLRWTQNTVSHQPSTRLCLQNRATSLLMGYHNFLFSHHVSSVGNPLLPALNRRKTKKNAKVLQLPISDSERRYVNLLFRYGMCALDASFADESWEMVRLRANKLLLISLLSACLAFESPYGVHARLVATNNVLDDHHPKSAPSQNKHVSTSTGANRNFRVPTGECASNKLSEMEGRHQRRRRTLARHSLHTCSERGEATKQL